MGFILIFYFHNSLKWKLLPCCSNAYEVLPAFKQRRSPPNSLHQQLMRWGEDGSRQASFPSLVWTQPSSQTSTFFPLSNHWVRLRSDRWIFCGQIPRRAKDNSICLLPWIFLFLLNYFSNFPNLYLPVVLFVWISGAFGQLLQIPRDHGLWSMTYHKLMCRLAWTFNIIIIIITVTVSLVKSEGFRISEF